MGLIRRVGFGERLWRKEDCFLRSILFLLNRIETTCKPHSVHGTNRVKLCLMDALRVFNLDHVIIGTESTALGTVMKRHQFKTRVMQGNDDIVDLICLAGDHEHSSALSLPFNTLPRHSI